MKHKIGDLVTMNKSGFSFHGNPSRCFESYTVAGEISYDAYIESICEIMSIQGVGKVVAINEEGDPKIKWKNSVKGIYYKSTMWYGKDDLEKLSLFQKLKYKILGRV
jgi:hypothetical protein